LFIEPVTQTPCPLIGVIANLGQKVIRTHELLEVDECANQWR
jgi:hypothetical protein